MAGTGETAQVLEEAGRKQWGEGKGNSLPTRLLDLSPFTAFSGSWASVRILHCIQALWHMSSQVPAVLPWRMLFSVTTEIKLIYLKWPKYKKGSSLRPVLGKEQPGMKQCKRQCLIFIFFFYTFTLHLSLHCSLVCIADMLLFTALIRLLALSGVLSPEQWPQGMQLLMHSL